MTKIKILEALNEKILLYQGRRKSEKLSDDEDLILKTYIMAYQEVEEMLRQGNAYAFVHSSNV